MTETVRIALAALLAVAPIVLRNSEFASTEAQAPDFDSMQVQTYAPPPSLRLRCRCRTSRGRPYT